MIPEPLAIVLREILEYLDDMNDGAPDASASAKEAGRKAEILRRAMGKQTQPSTGGSGSLIVWETDPGDICIHDDEADPHTGVGLFIKREEILAMIRALVKVEDGDGEQNVLGQFLVLSNEV